MLRAASSWSQWIPKLVHRLALEPNQDALIDVQSHGRCSHEIEDIAPGFDDVPFNTQQDIDDCKFPESGGKDGADVENPLEQKGECKIVGINVFQVVGNTVVSAQREEYLSNETQ